MFVTEAMVLTVLIRLQAPHVRDQPQAAKQVRRIAVHNPRHNEWTHAILFDGPMVR
jgi:hypothetical protein